MEKQITIENSSTYKFSDFARSIENIPKSYQDNDWFVKLRELDAKIHTKGLQDKITFADDRLVFVAYKVMADTNIFPTGTQRDWFLVGRYLDVYINDENKPKHYEELRKFVNIYLGFNGEQMSDEQAKEYKSLGKTLNKVDYGDLLPNFVLDAFATAEDGEAIQIEIPYVESATEEWQSLKSLCEMMLQDEGEAKEEWESLYELCKMMLNA